MANAVADTNSSIDTDPRRPTTLIQSGRAHGGYVRDLWRFRDLFWVFAVRDVSVRYRQTIVGVLWAVVRPLVTMFVFTQVFGKLAHFPSEGAPYSVLVAVALLPWQFFSSAVADSASSLLENATLVSKVYFPRMLLPASAILGNVLDAVILLVVILVVMAMNGIVPTWRIVVVPPLLALVFFAALGPGLALAALSVRYRDFRYVTPFVLQAALYASPVGFSSTAIPSRLRAAYALNPMVGIIDAFRWALLDTPLDTTTFAISLGVASALSLVGIVGFRAFERTFADVI